MHSAGNRAARRWQIHRRCPLFDTGGKLPPMSLIPVVHLELPISPRIFYKIRKVNLMFFLGAWGKMIHEKTYSKQSRDTVLLNRQYCVSSMNVYVSTYFEV
jgi:hypothetical protein